MARFSAALATLAVALCGCGSGGDVAAWSRAQQLWRARDSGAFAAWRSLDPSTPSGAEAQRRLRAANAEYRRGIDMLGRGDAAAREVLTATADVAPIDPALYLPLARACHARGLDGRAATMYRKFLAHTPSGADADAARAELASLGDDIAAFDPQPTRTPALPTLPLVLVATLLLLGLLAYWQWRRRVARPSLVVLAAENPELQPAIAYLVGCVRHELLKHRIVAVGDALRAINGDVSEAERRFALRRVFAGEPLPVAWAGHLAAFMRALGPRFDLVRHDAGFRDADRAIRTLASLEAPLLRGDAEAARAALAAQQRLATFDASLAQLTSGLQHTRVDDAFLSSVVADVRAELGTRAAIIELAPTPPNVSVESYDHDLRLVVRNVLRNAIVAAANGPRPARVAIAVDVELEASGEESVRIRVRDTNPAALPSPAPLSEARGLALVHAALRRCDGSLSVEPASDGFAKCVVIRLFRALDDVAEAA